MRIVFIGTPEFAVPSLQALIESKHEVCLVCSKPDKPQGKKQLILPTAVKVCAQQHGLEIFQPERLKTFEVTEKLTALAPDVIVVVAYGKILPKSVLDIPKRGCINLHGSLLPKYRGAAPIQWSIINGDKTTGVTTMFMDEGLDTGDILIQAKTFINDDETTEDLKKRLAKVGAEILLKTIDNLETGNLIRIKQDDSEATFSPILEKLTGLIDWTKTAAEIHNLVRGTNPWPIAYTTLRGQLFKIFKSKISTYRSLCPGKVISTNPVIVGCGRNTSLELMEVLIQGKKKMSASDFARGYRLSENIFLGS